MFIGTRVISPSRVLLAVTVLLTSAFLVPALQASQSKGQGTNGTGPSTRTGRQGGSTAPGPTLREWWNNLDTRREIGLSDEKAKIIDDLYQQWRVEVQPDVESLDRQRRALDRMTTERTASESTYRMQVQRVNDASSRVWESRTVLLYRIIQVLTPEQHKKLQALENKDRQSDGRGRGGPGLNPGAPR